MAVKKTRKLFTINILRKPLMFLLTAVMLIAALPVTTAEAKKLGKIPMGQGVQSLEGQRTKLFTGDNCNEVDYPQRGYTWAEMYSQLYCKPGDTFTLVTDNEKFEQLNHDSIKTYGKVLWHTSNSDVATVNKNGKVTVKGEGYAVISAGIMKRGKNIYGKPFDEEEILYHHHIFSGPVLQLKKTNVKAVAKNAHAIEKRGRVSIIRTKDSAEETEELINAFVKEFNKLGHNAREGGYEIGNFTYYW